MRVLLILALGAAARAGDTDPFFRLRLAMARSEERWAADGEVQSFRVDVRVVRTGRPDLTTVFVAHAGEHAQLEHLSDLTYQTGIHVKLVEGGWFLDPVLETVERGFRFRAVLRRGGPDRVRIAWRLDAAEPEAPVRDVKIPVTMEHDVRIQLPAIVSVAASGRTLLEPREEVTIASVPLPAGKQGGTLSLLAKITPLASKNEPRHGTSEPVDPLLRASARLGAPDAGELELSFLRLEAALADHRVHVRAADADAALRDVEPIRSFRVRAMPEPGVVLAYKRRAYYLADVVQSDMKGVSALIPRVETSEAGLDASFWPTHDVPTLSFSLALEHGMRHEKRELHGHILTIEAPHGSSFATSLPLRAEANIATIDKLEPSGWLAVLVRRER